MTNRRNLLTAAAALGAMSPFASAAKAAVKSGAQLAPRPPMGWNSWNSFATTITEQQSLDVAKIMQEKLLPFGYDVFTVDIQWYEGGASSYTYRDDAPLTMDAYGRLLPAPNRFPSSVDGKGFKPLADQIHAMGMKFGVHLMRGIPRQAYNQDLPVYGTNYTAKDIGDPKSICPWNGDMYGVDMTKPGAQAYYNSVFKLFAEWGVDFVKMDDMSRPYKEHWQEIEAARKAIVASGRDMALSLSPGETDLNWANHVGQYAQMWRISDDFWDDWKLLRDQFQRLENWNPYRKPGAWPDADMLPLGLLSLGERMTRFTVDEQHTVMSLWAIARSPLIMGGDLRALDQATLDLLTNTEVLKVNQYSQNNRPIYKSGGKNGVIGWVADPEDMPGRYVAFFNTSDEPRKVSESLSVLGVKPRAVLRDLWAKKDLGTVEGRLTLDLPPHASALYLLS